MNPVNSLTCIFPQKNNFPSDKLQNKPILWSGQQLVHAAPTTRTKGAKGMSGSVDFWYFLISRSATVPARQRSFFSTRPRVTASPRKHTIVNDTYNTKSKQGSNSKIATPIWYWHIRPHLATKEDAYCAKKLNSSTNRTRNANSNTEKCMQFLQGNVGSKRMGKHQTKRCGEIMQHVRPASRLL